MIEIVEWVSTTAWQIKMTLLSEFLIELFAALREETDWLDVMTREASISTMLLLVGLSQAVSVAER